MIIHVATLDIWNSGVLLSVTPPTGGVLAPVLYSVARSTVDPPPASGSLNCINFSNSAWALSIIARACQVINRTILNVPPTNSSISSKEPRPPIALSRPSATFPSDCTDPACERPSLQQRSTQLLVHPGWSSRRHRTPGDTELAGTRRKPQIICHLTKRCHAATERLSPYIYPRNHQLARSMVEPKRDIMS
eukprot:COSAG02_NODE_1160_length_14177_cov_208.515130_11_plen_191_part_00